MFERLKEILTDRLEGRVILVPGHEAAVAAAMLLLEVAWADHDFAPEELARTRTALLEIFSLPGTAADAILTEARRHHAATVSLYPFTRLVNGRLTRDEKQLLLESCWRLARAQSGVDKHEEYTIRRIADLLHLSHDEFIAAKRAALRGETPAGG
jgi:uncharacterized tellurite resistance protein B-like protein